MKAQIFVPHTYLTLKFYCFQAEIENYKPKYLNFEKQIAWKILRFDYGPWKESLGWIFYLVIALRISTNFSQIRRRAKFFEMYTPRMKWSFARFWNTCTNFQKLTYVRCLQLTGSIEDPRGEKWYVCTLKCPTLKVITLEQMHHRICKQRPMGVNKSSWFSYMW